ncbi:hypothetical protein [Streptantibioticus silvisoli]|uniref:Uncharacterized protein n=1 Tax=Streptantibioticus silvisoli TaxID=2705255 RepID=A0ABT6W6R9_9ACTN|nr:hypothetical protein [Streptantibioticus silvisoli]MDI5966446.1 hypothetical protein [Streptantibioticus silvisoli]
MFLMWFVGPPEPKDAFAHLVRRYAMAAADAPTDAATPARSR